MAFTKNTYHLSTHLYDRIYFDHRVQFHPLIRSELYLVRQFWSEKLLFMRRATAVITKYHCTIKHDKSCIKTPLFKLELLVDCNRKLSEACLFDLFNDNTLWGPQGGKCRIRPVVAEFDLMNDFFFKKKGVPQFT